MFKVFNKIKGKGKNKSINRNNIILHNVYILYLIFVIALVDFLTLVYINDYYSATIFVLVGLLTSFFNKNMIVILFIAIAITHIMKYGKRAATEGFDFTKEFAEGFTEGLESENKETPESTEKPSVTTTPSQPDDVTLPLTLDMKKNEAFSQDNVYTTDEDREINKTEKLILTQEKLLNSMNKYKPLLDTLQGITKNMAVVKGVASFTDE